MSWAPVDKRSNRRITERSSPESLSVFLSGRFPGYFYSIADGFPVAFDFISVLACYAKDRALTREAPSIHL